MYEDMDIEELNEELDKLLADKDSINESISYLHQAMNKLSEVEQDGIDNMVQDIEQQIMDLEEMLTSIKIDMEDIEMHMEILESTYDEYAERNSEYRQMQGF